MTSSFDKIVTCIDLTKTDKSVIESAYSLAKAVQAKQVIFLNVIKNFNLPDNIKKEMPELETKAIEERSRKINAQISKYINPDFEYKIEIRKGSETKEILKYISISKADVLIIGKKKDSDSVLATRIARRVPCNFLIIPDKSILKFDKILLPVDFSEYSILSLKAAINLTKNTNSTIYTQNVYSVPNGFRYSGKSFAEFAKIMRGNAEKHLSMLLKQADISPDKIIPIHSLDKKEGVVKIILKEAKQKSISLILIGAKGRTAASALFIGSKSERMIRINNSVPTLLIRKKGVITGLLESLKDL